MESDWCPCSQVNHALTIRVDGMIEQMGDLREHDSGAAIGCLETAIDQVWIQRATLGALQNRLSTQFQTS